MRAVRAVVRPSGRQGEHLGEEGGVEIPEEGSVMEPAMAGNGLRIPANFLVFEAVVLVVFEGE